MSDIPPIEAPLAAPSALALLRVFRHRNYRLFFSGQLVSLMGTWITAVAQGWLVYSMTHSPLLLGVTSFAGQVPVFFISSFAGMISDRVDRRKLLILTQGLAMLQAATLATLTLMGVIQVWEIVALALFKGFVNAFDVPTRQAFTIDMVGREDLRNAISLNSVMFNLARVVGPTIAGVLVATVGEGLCFTIDAISYGAVLISLLLMQFAPRERRVPGRPFRELKEGFAYVWHTREIRVSLMLIAVCSAFGASYIPLLPAFARDVLHEGSQGLGLLYGAIGAGALIGAYALARIHDRHITRTPLVVGAGVRIVADPVFALALSAAVDGAALAHRLQLDAARRFHQHHHPDGLTRRHARARGGVLRHGLHGHDAVGLAAAGLDRQPDRCERGGDDWRCRVHRGCVRRLFGQIEPINTLSSPASTDFSPPVYGGSAAVGSEGGGCGCTRPLRRSRTLFVCATSPVNGGGKRDDRF